MSESGLSLFDTSLGWCGIAWRRDGLAGVQLPEGGEGATLQRLKRRFPDLAPAARPEYAGRAIAAIRALLEGEDVDLGDIRLDESSLGRFESAVLRAARAIPRGQTLTYGELAAQIGDPQAAQAVGRALGRNPWPIVVPCHRITAAAGRTGGFSAHGGAATKLRLLEIEGALRPETLPLFAGEGRS
jgi:methylated-DNA-[protein]-cysteine S-methyltransferase